MARPDLLALDDDALALLANRGLVKRARAEVGSGQLTWELAEVDDSVTCRWSDGVECLLPAGKPLADGRCSCPATTLCRHLLRTVMAYQLGGAPGEEPATPAEPAPPAEPATPAEPGADAPRPEAAPDAPRPDPAAASPASTLEPWDPGEIPDAALEGLFRRTELARIRRRFEEGQVLELVRSARPGARIHTLSVTLRFLVRGDARYTHCDCAEPAPCSHVPLAVWAFRLLEPGRGGGIVATAPEGAAVPAAVLDEVERALLELAESGISGAPPALPDRLRRIEERCLAEELVWPSAIAAELAAQHRAYLEHDARFAPDRVAALAGELAMRSDAIRSATGAVPQLFVRGSRSDRTVDVGAGRLVGLGCGAELRRGGADLTAYLQDADSGMVVAVRREFADPDPASGEAPRELWQLAARAAVQSHSLASLAAGQLLIRGGRRAADGTFIAGRARAALNPQGFQWEALRQPVLVEDFSELAAGLAAQPPACLRPRRAGLDFHACAVAAVDAVEFDQWDQSVRAVLRDAAGTAALLRHPFTHRGREGAEALLARLRARPETLRFAAGRARLEGAALVLEPVSLVFQEGAGRSILQPWIDRPGQGAEAETRPDAAPAPRGAGDPTSEFPRELMALLGEQWLVGLRRSGEQEASAWRELRARGAALGFHRLLEPVAALAEALEQKSRVLRWDAAPAARSLLLLSVLAVLCRDLGTAPGG